MFFIGQDHIMSQLYYILPHLYESSDGMAMLFRGPSGWGKTTMCLKICNYLTGGRFDYSTGDNPKINENYRVHFIDEIHLLEHPETIYPVIDSGKFIFIFATNDVAILPEALVNRCSAFTFVQYTEEEMRSIARSITPIVLSDKCIDYLSEVSGKNPRVLKAHLYKLSIINQRAPGTMDNIGLDEFKSIMSRIFGINDGMDVVCNRYMECLNSIGGTASIQTISSMLHIDQATLRLEVEPVLLYKNKIVITSKGRSVIK